MVVEGFERAAPRAGFNAHSAIVGKNGRDVGPVGVDVVPTGRGVEGAVVSERAGLTESQMVVLAFERGGAVVHERVELPDLRPVADKEARAGAHSGPPSADQGTTVEP